MEGIIATTEAPAAIGPYSQGRKTAGGLVFVSGQLPIDPASGAMPETAAEQTRQSLANVRKILEAAGTDMDHVVKTTVFLQHMEDFAAMNEVYKTFFSEGVFPARSAVEIAKLPKGALVEIEAVAEA